MTKNAETKKFPGFPKLENNCWQYPRTMDFWWSYLNGSEQKCLDYLFRRLLGFNKKVDQISLSQFEHGIRKKDGTQLDTGTGLQRSVIIAALKSLEGKGFIRVERKLSKTNTYQLICQE